LADEDSNVTRAEINNGRERTLNSNAAGIAADSAGAACGYKVHLFGSGIDYRQIVSDSVGGSQKQWVLTGCLCCDGAHQRQYCRQLACVIPLHEHPFLLFLPEFAQLPAGPLQSRGAKPERSRASARSDQQRAAGIGISELHMSIRSLSDTSYGPWRKTAIFYALWMSNRGGYRPATETALSLNSVTVDSNGKAECLRARSLPSS
jgi:hypothetical protein